MLLETLIKLPFELPPIKVEKIFIASKNKEYIMDAFHIFNRRRHRLPAITFTRSIHVNSPHKRAVKLI